MLDKSGRFLFGIYGGLGIMTTDTNVDPELGYQFGVNAEYQLRN